MREGFIKFPRTPHLTWLGDGAPRGDKVLAPDEAATLLSRPLSIEEKIDGSCVGISVDEHGALRAQSRGDYIACELHPNFRPLGRWLATREAGLREALGRELVLFGEWCWARHSVEYDRLPDWFLPFDVFDRCAERFWSRRRRDRFAADLGLHVPPLLGEGTFRREAILRLMGRSHIGPSDMEGVYLRADEGAWLAGRAKIVRASWLQVNEEHWSRRPIVQNRVDQEPELELRAGL